MQKRSTRWLLGIAASTVCLSHSIVFAAPGTYADGKIAGENAGNLAVGTYGTKELVNQNINAPMMQSGTMSTVDGSQTFNSAFSSPSSSKFLIVTMEPAGTGDLQKVTIAQDLNKDGLVDSTYVLPMPISGVCANGFISCTPGTWSGCGVYKWSSDPNGAVTEAIGSITNLGGCFCINSSCGSNLAWTNSAIVLDAIGGGVVGAIHSGDPSLMITSVQKDLTSITYYGSSPSKSDTATAKITSLTGSPQVTELSTFYSNPTALTNMRDGLAISQSSDPSSFYSLVTNVGQKSSTKNGTCSITRSGGVNSKSDSFYNTGSLTLSSDHNVFLRVLETMPLKNYSFEISTSNKGSAVPANQTTVANIVLPTSPSVSVKLTKALFTISMSGSGCDTATGSIDGVLNGFNTYVTFPGVCGANGVQSPSFSWSSLFEFTKDEYAESIVDDCSSYVSDPSCKILNETVGGVVTVRDYNPTGLSPLGQCMTFPGITQQMQICRPWWQKKRQYVCSTGSAYDFNDVSKRFGKVINSTDGKNGLSFTDTMKDKDGNWFDNATSSIPLPPVPPVPTCELACKTRKASLDTQVSLAGTVNTMRKDGSDNYSYAYRPCVNNACPAQAGEEIMLDCQCINEFSQAAVIIQTLRLSGNDNICSSGTKAPMKP